MKKIVIYVLLLVALTFVIPIFFTKVTVINDALIQESDYDNLDTETADNGEDVGNRNVDVTPYDYNNYKTIKLLHSKTNTIEEIPLDEYLYGVVSAEMPVDFDMEALKAQATVARTYTIYTITHNQSKHGDAHICDDSACCQAWITKEDRMARWEEDRREDNWNRIMIAVNETKGKVITYEGAPINAFFHSNSGGATEQPVNVWRRKRISISTNSRNCR